MLCFWTFQTKITSFFFYLLKIPYCRIWPFDQRGSIIVNAIVFHYCNSSASTLLFLCSLGMLPRLASNSCTPKLNDIPLLDTVLFALLILQLLLFSVCAYECALPGYTSVEVVGRLWNLILSHRVGRGLNLGSHVLPFTYWAISLPLPAPTPC